MLHECKQSTAQLEKEVDRDMDYPSSDSADLSDTERRRRSREYDFRKMYKKLLRREKKTGGLERADTKLHQIILKDS